MQKPFLAALLASLALTAAADEKRVETKTLSKDGIEVKVGGNDGYTISVDGVPFSSASKLFVVDPAWKERYYGYNDDRKRISLAETTSTVPGGEGLVLPLSSSRADVIEATQTLELLPGRKLRLALDLHVTSNTRGLIENRIASIGEGWLTSRKWSAESKDGATTAGTTPAWAPGEEPRTSTIAADLKKATFELPQGPLTIEVSGNAEVALLDYRRNMWAEGQKYYWFGLLGSPVSPKERLNYEIIFTFPKMSASADKKAAEAKVDIKTGEIVYQAQPAEDRIIPTPKQVKWGNGVLAAGSEVGVYLDSKKIASGAAVVEEYSQRLSRIYGVNLKLAEKENAFVQVETVTATMVNFPQNDEAYILNVAEDKISAVVKNEVGLRHALRTLEQLIRSGKDDKVAFRRAQVTDYPSLPFRAIHFFTGKDAQDLQIKMISEILAPLKINNLIYQVDYVKWESQPQIHSDMLGMDKADATAVGQSAEKQGIDIVPLVNTFGHSEWLLQRPEMRYLADDPEDPYAYDPSNPKVYEICEGIYNEAIEMFKPTIMHIGHDEVSMDGFPKKPENKAIGATQLLINDTKHYYDFLKKKNIRTMIWGDMFLAPGEAPDATLADTTEESARRRSLLPKDILIADWHYKAAAVDEYKSLGIFNKEGFETYACTWFAPDNIVRFTKAAAQQHKETSATHGLIQTTWAGYSFDMDSLLANVEQYAAYVLAAEAAWTGGYEDSEDVPFDFQAEFVRRWNGEYMGGKSQKGWHVDLSAAATPVDPLELSLAPEALRGLKPGSVQLGNYRFNLPAKNDRLAAVQIAGAFTDNKSAPAIALPVEAVSKHVYLAIATPVWMPDRSSIGNAVFTMEDGTQHKVELRYGKNILSIKDPRQTLLAPVAWSSEEPKPELGGAVLHVLNWENPTPNLKVKSITLESADGGPGILLFGISGAE